MLREWYQKTWCGNVPTNGFELKLFQFLEGVPDDSGRCFRLFHHVTDYVSHAVVVFLEPDLYDVFHFQHRKLRHLFFQTLNDIKQRIYIRTEDDG
ncbi:hypothetical protein HanRHA438_Chr14g0676521 [Helianthus annuus]|nr:hypothetical protein HanHA300_Chr14g0542351 [Helianthus annuus]KAJ0470732.1 hypothetical protein HanIR_Chr14g0721961 [Helianthus annuus]KAJ0487410.1 hypothetical protein HanHA89_Chr14g0590091 [Helianthus annuus]KAJ0657852.1 hypothetical protein HanLR1_Chr14g0551291 [Helianthus annuus]KAJ0661519.1 hypothetical protein HanOQP8_Chr14g0549411 [Helianthus annuus]